MMTNLSPAPTRLSFADLKAELPRIVSTDVGQLYQLQLDKYAMTYEELCEIAEVYAVPLRASMDQYLYKFGLNSVGGSNP